jgi:hypothetical protein
LFSVGIGVTGEEIAALQEKMKLNPFVTLQEEYSTYYKINKQTKNSAHYIAPSEIKLPPNSQGKISTFQYVPIAETVASIISDPGFMQQTQLATPHGFLYDIKDGSAWKDNKYFQENPDALTGQLYSDAVELENPLGAAKGVNKVVNVYFTLVDLPKYLRSKKESIFLVLSVKEKDLKENYSHVFRPLINDLKKLESGVRIGGQVVKLGVICYSADNLEASVVGGFSQCFSSADICRVCHLQHKDLTSLSGIPKGDPWTQQDYDAAVTNIQAGLHGEFGLNTGCLFNELNAFHCVGQMPLDIMHDFMERVAAFDGMSILKALSSTGLFTFEGYNSILNDVKLKGYEAADRPLLVNSKNKRIPGKAMAVGQQLRLMPFLIWRLLEEKVPESDLIDLLVLLARIQEFIMADKISSLDVDNFRDVIVEFFAKRKLCEEELPGVFIKLTPKYHYLGSINLFFFVIYV